MGNNSILATNAALYKKVNFDPEKDFAPISLVGSQANILVVNPERAGEVDGGADRARCAPIPASSTTPPPATARRRISPAELFKAEAKVDIVHVPYKGAAPALQDVIAGHVQMMFATAASVVPHIQSGKVRALAVTTLKRTAVFPELATIDELGLKGFDATTWHGLVAPAKTPRDVDRALHRATVEALNDPAVRKSLAISASISSATRRRNSPPTSRRRSRNGPRS